MQGFLMKFMKIQVELGHYVWSSGASGAQISEAADMAVLPMTEEIACSSAAFETF